MKQWVVVTGGGSGIGRMLVQKYSQTHHVLTCGRRLAALETTKAGAMDPSKVTVVEADIAKADDRQKFTRVILEEENSQVYLLVQNAAIGDPAQNIASMDPTHLEYAFQVNVVAPLALVQLLLPALQRARQHTAKSGRVLHLGTSVAHTPQPGTLTYGVTKLAFYRLYQQLNVEGIVCGSLSPGLVDTEGVRDHVDKARACGLPHVEFFDRALAPENDNHSVTTDPNQLFEFIQELMQMEDATFSSKEWRFREWRSKVGKSKTATSAVYSS